jgi:hypothetical protein
VTSPIIPDVPTTYLAWRVWGLDKRTLTLTSTTPAGVSRKDREAQRESHPLLAGLGDPLGAWPKASEIDPTGALAARCHAPGSDEQTDDWRLIHPEGRVPSPECAGAGGHGCGIYATTDLGVANRYLSGQHPVFGLVELTGRVLDCEQGYRAEFARVAAILMINEALTIDQGMLAKIAEAYSVPTIVPVSLVPEDHRDLIDAWQNDRDGEAELVNGIESWLAGQ